MTEPIRTNDWRFVLSIAAGVGLALPVASIVERALQPALGSWGAFLLSVLAAALTGGLVGLVVVLPTLLHKRPQKTTTSQGPVGPGSGSLP